MARPTSLTPAVQAKVCELIREGLRFEQCAAGAGISYATFRGWRQAGKDGREPYAAFLAATKEAELDFERHCLRMVAAQETGWQRWPWMLQHRYPERYCAPVRYAERMAELKAEARALEKSRSKSKDAAIDPAEVAAYLRDHFPDVLRAVAATLPTAQPESKGEAH